jgi:hypothetical protein
MVLRGCPGLLKDARPTGFNSLSLTLNIKQKNGKSQIISEAHSSGEEKSSSQPLLRKNNA